MKLLRLLQNYNPVTEEAGVRARLNETLETILNKAQEPPKSKKVQHSNAKNAVLFEAINLIIHSDSEPNLLVRACNQLGQFLSNRETNLRLSGSGVHVPPGHIGVLARGGEEAPGGGHFVNENGEGRVRAPNGGGSFVCHV